MTWRTWRRHFETNATRPIPSIGAPPLGQAQRSALARSLARFQLGESGEGRIAHEIDRATLPGVDEDYRQALKLFVKEEGRHARILGLMVKDVGGQLLSRQWTERLFVHGRRLLGLRFKLLVLLAAEVVGITFYGALARALGPSPLREALLQICGDEEHHLTFHRDFFRAQTEVGGLGSKLLWCAWWPLAWAAGLMVVLDHRATLRALDVPRLRLVKELRSRIVEAGHFGGGEATEVLSSWRRQADSAPSVRRIET